MTEESEAEETEYEERYCAFVDILGFRGLINDVHSGALDFRRLRNLLKRIHDPYHGKRDPFETFDLRVQSISDAVAFSATANSAGLQTLFLALEDLAMGLLFEGYLLRGAVVKGMLYHDDSTVFGKALVDAYKFESETARYPRIMVTRQVVEDARNSPDRKILTQFLRQDEDGPFYLHVLRRMAHEIREELKKDPKLDPSENEQLAYYVIAGAKLRTRVWEAIDDPRIFEKVKWFACYWNGMLPAGHSNFPPIEGPGFNAITWMKG
jgi:hypothetical protein